MSTKNSFVSLSVAIMAMAISNTAAIAAPGEKWYSEWWGSDAGLWINFSTGCGRDLGFKSKCYKFLRINSFAIEADGTIFCDANAPAIDKPLSRFSKCTSRGWQTVR